MQDKILTISIVTADRPSIFECLLRLKVLPMISNVDVIVHDNSRNKDHQNQIQLLCDVCGFTYRYFTDFIECRRQAVRRCVTEYFTILDDDDYFSVETIPMILKYLNKYPGIDAIHFRAVKEGRVELIPEFEKLIKSKFQKLRMLNRFNHYESDRKNKIYLWNSGWVIRKNYYIGDRHLWEFKGCDDILPITDLYINGRILMVNKPICNYTVQNTIQAKKSITELTQLETNMYNSYVRLMRINSDFMESLILRRAIKNSISQLEYIDGYNPRRLKRLCSSYPLNRTSLVEV